LAAALRHAGLLRRKAHSTTAASSVVFDLWRRHLAANGLTAKSLLNQVRLAAESFERTHVRLLEKVSAADWWRIRSAEALFLALGGGGDEAPRNSPGVTTEVFPEVWAQH